MTETGTGVLRCKQCGCSVDCLTDGQCEQCLKGDRCATCLFYRVSKDEKDSGVCRRFPPQSIVEGDSEETWYNWAHPRITPDGWCGEWVYSKTGANDD